MAMAEVSPDAAFDSSCAPNEEPKDSHGVKKLTDFEASQLGLLELVSQMQWKHVITRMKEAPEEASAKQSMCLEGEETEGYPMHLAVSLKPPTHVVQALLDAYPSVVKVREDKNGRLPLHIACIHTASAQVLKILLERHEESLRITDKARGRLPLHFACMYGSPFEISLLVGAEQRALVFKDADGKTPMDLAQESENPHREAILKRLEDRTRVVTSAMIQRRKQQQDNPSSDKRRNSFRKTESVRKSSSSKSDVEEPTKFGSRRSTSIGAMAGYDKKSSRSVSSNSSKHVSSDQRREKFRRGTHAVDDSDIGKKSRSSKKKKDHRSTRSKDEWRSTMSAKPVPTTEDVDITPKLKNGRPGLLSNFKAETSDDAFRGSGRQRTVQRGNKLDMFLQATSLDESSDDENENDHKSMGARSLPAHMHSSQDHTRIAKSYMFDTDSSDDFDIAAGSESFKAFRSNERLDGSSVGLQRKENSALNDVEERMRDLDVRRTALSQECESINATISKKEADAKQSRETINDLHRAIAELQDRLKREYAALTLSETGIQLQKETLAVHEIKIKAVDSEKSSLVEKRATLEAEIEANEKMSG